MEPVVDQRLIRLVFKHDHSYNKKGVVVWANRRHWRDTDREVVFYWHKLEDVGKDLLTFQIIRDYLEQEIPDPLFQLVFAQYYHGNDTVQEVKFPPMEWEDISIAAWQFTKAMKLEEIRRNFWKLDTPEVMYTVRFDKVEV